MNLNGILGIVLIVLGIVFFIEPTIFNYLLAIALIVGGAYLAARGFGLMK